MNWTSFLLTLALVYLAYYSLNLLYDLLMARKPPKQDSTGEQLFFDEDVTPEIIEPAPEPESRPEPVAETEQAPEEATLAPQAQTKAGSASQRTAAPAIHSTGAVGLRQLFNLAKDNLIEYTGALTY